MTDGFSVFVIDIVVSSALVIDKDWFSVDLITEGHVAKVHEWEGEPLVTSPQGQAGVGLLAPGAHGVDDAHAAALLEHAGTLLT